MRQTTTIRYLISIFAIILIGLRLILPSFQLDNTILILAVVVILPWLSGVFRSIEFPSGHKIELQEFKEASDKVLKPVDEDDKQANDNIVSSKPSYYSIIAADPNLAVVGLRIEIEKRLKSLASHYKLTSQASITTIVKQLSENGVIDPGTASGLLDLINFGNQAAHGAKIDYSVTEWIFSSGKQVIERLDFLIAKKYDPNIEQALSKVLIILNYEGSEITDFAISILKLIQTDGFVRFTPNNQLKSKVGIKLVKMGVIRPIEENESKKWEKKHVITPLGIALYSKLISQ